MAEFLSDMLAYLPGGLYQGFQAANLYRRQNAMDAFQMRMRQEEMAIRKATEERLGRLEDERMRLARESERRQRAIAEMKTFLEPAEALAKLPQAAADLAPAYEAAAQSVNAPEVTPAGAGVLAEGAPGFGKDVLRATRDKAIAEAADRVRAEKAGEKEEDRDFRREMLAEQVRARREAAAAALLGRQEMAAAGAERKAAVLKPAETKEIDNLSDVLELAEVIKAGKQGIDTGPVASFRNKWAARLGVDDPATSAFYSQARDQLSAYVRSISGTAASDKERAYLLTVLPSPSDNDPTFVSKLDKFVEKTRAIRQRRLATLASQGRDVSPYAEPDPGEPPTSSAPPSAEDDEVILALPDGRRKRVSRSMAEGLARMIKGATVVEP